MSADLQLVPVAPAAQTPPFSERERLLIAKCEEAVRDGSQLEAWCRQAALPFLPLDLKKKYRLPNTAHLVFGGVNINGVARTVMACRQEVTLGRISRSDAPELLREFVLGQFIKRAGWRYENGLPGGFTYEKSLYKTMEGSYARFPTASASESMDWRELGRQYAWILMTVQIHDFVVQMGPWQKRFKEAAYVVPHSGSARVSANPSPETALEVSIGYPFVDVAPLRNFFGFGPGKFGAAIKLFSFLLTREGEVRVRMIFAAAPRSRKVLDFGKSIPDPVYAGAELARYITFGLFKPQIVHDRMDTQMLALHCQVHQTLMEGVEKAWNQWVEWQSMPHE